MVDTGVRYWNDSEVNGNDDVDLYETKRWESFDALCIAN